MHDSDHVATCSVTTLLDVEHLLRIKLKDRRRFGRVVNWMELVDQLGSASNRHHAARFERTPAECMPKHGVPDVGGQLDHVSDASAEWVPCHSMAAKRKKTEAGVVASNRRARHDFEIGETFECGMVLKGSEVKSLRESKVTISESYARVYNNELWLYGLHIGQYSSSGAAFAHAPERDRKLLVHRHEIERIQQAIDHDGRTLVPLKLYFKEGKAKIEIAVARRRRIQDKRQAIRERDDAMEARRAMSEAKRR